jgi:Fe2+ transport system protein B
MYKWFIRIKEKSFFILELPVYRAPRWHNIGITMLAKAKIFVTDAGKIIMIISLVLWALSSYGPSDRMNEVSRKYEQMIDQNPSAKQELSLQKNAELLRHSYAGILGRSIEPVIAPLGFDWKIGIALITSFAAVEVFVGTMATLTVWKEVIRRSIHPDPEDASVQKTRWIGGVYPGHRHVADDFLYAGHAVHEHPGHRKKGDKELEMADYPVGLHDITCLFYEPAGIPAFEIIFLIKRL